MLDGYWLDKKREFSKNTVRNYSRIFDYFLAFVGDAEFDAISTNDVRRFLNYLADAKEYSKRSVHDAWIPLSSLWTWAEGEEGTPHIIRGKIAIPDFPESIIEPFTQEEIKALLIAAEYSKPWETRNGKTVQSKRPTADRDRAIILTLLDTGIRAQELCDLALADYDQKRGRLHIQHGKGDKSRMVFLGMRSQKAMWRYLSERRTKRADPLFATRSGEQIERNNLRHTLQRIAEQAEVTNVYPHRFRHTFAINYLRNGGNILVLQALLGHESLDTVQIYVKLAELDLERSQQHSPVDNWKL